MSHLCVLLVAMILSFAVAHDSIITEYEPEQFPVPASPLPANVLQVRKRWTRSDTAGFEQFEAAGVPKRLRKSIYVSVISDPPKSSVKHVVILAAGQQGVQIYPLSAFANGVTGQTNKYKSKDVEDLDPKSVAVKLKSLQWFPDEETFMAVVYDTAYYFGLSEENKAKMAQGYTDWIVSKFDVANLQSLYLGGSSRGGCLMTVVGKQIKQRAGFANVPLYITTVDGVANWKQGELETSDTKVINPLDKDLWCWQNDIQKYFEGISNVHMYQIHGGQNVSPVDKLIGKPRCFHSKTSPAWYTQEWTTLGHSTLGRDYSKDTFDRVLNWLKKVLKK